MLFTSYGFIGFVAILLVLYYRVPKRMQWVVLLLFSYIFYFCAGASYLFYIIITTLSIYYMGCAIEDLENRQLIYLKENAEKLGKEEKQILKNKTKRKKRQILIIGLLFNLGILFVVKYANFMIDNVNIVMEFVGNRRRVRNLDIMLPMGISFYIFQAVGYLIDVYRGSIRAERSLFRFALFVSFFPQLVQGPISRFKDLSKTLYSEHSFDKKMISYGLERILWGFFKKLVIADRLLPVVEQIIQNPQLYAGAYVFVGMMFYAVELYADFTGGIDITIGVAQLLGISITENFKRPYFSKSIKEYWRRWHISMGTWFTEYVFYPVSVCEPLLKLSRYTRSRLGVAVGRRIPVYIASFTVWLATGIWHGAGWNFIVWGMINWIIIMLSQELEPIYQMFHRTFHVKNSIFFRTFQIVRTIFLMSSIRTLDCYRNVPLTFYMYGTIFTEGNWRILWDGSLLRLGIDTVDYAILIIGLLLMIMVSLLQRTESVRSRIAKQPYIVKLAVWYGLFLIVLLTGVYGSKYDASQFIYYQF